MITSAIIGALIAAVNLLFGLLPDTAALPPEIGNAFSRLSEVLAQANAFIPVSDLLNALSLFAAVEITIIAAKGLFILWRLIRG